MQFLKKGSIRQYRQRKHVRGIQIVIPLVQNCGIGKDGHPVTGGSVGFVNVAEKMQTGMYHSHSTEQLL